jgi:GntR family phosphonate transport system transcriptional regulator
MRLERNRDVVLWREISDALRAEITAGHRQPGDRVETEAALAERFHVNRHTIRRALLALQEDGLIATEQGRGSFVAEPMVDYRLGRRTRFRSIVENQAMEASRLLLGISHRPADEAIATALEIPLRTPVVAIESLGFANGRPTGIGLHHFDEAAFPGIAESYRETRSVTQALARFGITDYFRRDSTVSAIMPSARDCKLLSHPPSRPILLVEGVNVDGDGRPIEYSVSRMPTVRMRLRVSHADAIAAEPG